MKLNDDYVQAKYKAFLKASHKGEIKQESVYDRLQKNAQAKAQQNMIMLQAAYDNPLNNSAKKSKFVNVSQDRL